MEIGIPIDGKSDIAYVCSHHYISVILMFGYGAL